MKRRIFLSNSLIFGTSIFSTAVFAKLSLARQSLSSSRDSAPLIFNETLLAQKPNLTFPPVPEEDPDNGRNSNAQRAGTPEPTPTEKQAFIKEISGYALPLEKQYGVPACVIIAIAVFSSGFGRTRIAYYANNLFNLKYINRKKDCRDGSCENIKTYQLKGQDNELANTAIMITKKYGDDDRFVFDESRRSGNRYRVFNSYQESVNFLVTEVWLKDEKYKAAFEQYQTNMKTLGANKAAKQFVFDLASAGFTFSPAKDYQESVGKVMDEWNLC
jgi:flagellum-specific peptidoglycan hydrolase FlgJ